MSSLKRHVVQQHPEAAEKIGLQGYKRKNIEQPDQQTASPPPAAKRLKTVTIQVDPVKFHSGLVEMAAINSISFNFFNSHACHATIGPIAKGLNIPIYGEAIASYIPPIANIIRDLISKELKTFFCLEFDGASRHNRKIFGINARIVRGGKIHTRTLSMMEIVEKQTARNLKNTVEESLKMYSTDVTHVYSCTSDNARNAQKCGDELAVCQEKALTSIVVQGEVSNDEHDGDQDIHHQDDNDQDDDEDASVSGEIDEMLEAIENIILNGNESCITTLKCAAHTVNLVANDAVDRECETLKKIRKIVKDCRKQNYNAFFRRHKVPLPKIDVETRWGSLFAMLNSIHVKKTIFAEIGDLFDELRLTADDWAYIEEYISAFEPLFVLTKALQGSELILGDVFKLVKICELKVTKLPTDNRFAEALTTALKQRTKHMMGNAAFKAAMLFDPRWCFVDSPYITMEDKLEAIVSIMRYLNNLNNE